MIRTGAEYTESIRDGRQVWVNGERVRDVPTHPYFKPLIDNWVAEDRRKLLDFARDLLNSDYAGHRLTFALFAQSPPLPIWPPSTAILTLKARWTLCAAQPICRIM